MKPLRRGIELLKINTDQRISVDTTGDVNLKCNPGDDFSFSFSLLPDCTADEIKVKEIRCVTNDVIRQVDAEFYPPKPISSIKLDGRCRCSNQTGEYKVPLVIITTTENIIIEFTIEVTTPLIDIMKPATPYVKPSYTNCYKGNREGSNMRQLQDKDDALRNSMPLHHEPIPEITRKIIKSGFNETNNNLNEDETKIMRNMKSLLKQPLNHENYKEKLGLLLDCEQIEEEKELEKFDLLNVRVHSATNGSFFVSTNNFPCKPGNMLIMSKAKTEWREVIIAHVTTVETDRVFFESRSTTLQSIIHIHNWDIGLTVSTYNYTMLKRSLLMADELGIDKRTIFPNKTSLYEPRLMETQVFYNQAITNNKEQVEAIRSIVDQRSGLAPVYFIYLITLVYILPHTVHSLRTTRNRKNCNNHRSRNPTDLHKTRS